MKIEPLAIANVDLLGPLVDEFISSQMLLSFRPDYQDAFRIWIQRLSKDPDAAIFVARDESDIIGIAVGTIIENGPLVSPDRIGYIPILVVSSKCRRKGAGGKLWEMLKTWFSSKEVSEIQLYTAIDSDESQNFWESFGFAVILERRRKWIGKKD